MGHWDKLPGQVAASPSLEGFRKCGDVGAVAWGSGGLSARLKVGLGDLRVIPTRMSL